MPGTRYVGEEAVRIEAFASLNALPPAARALFGQGPFSTLDWYASVEQAAVPAESQPCYQVARHGEAVLGVCPMWRRPRGYAAMTTPYTVQWYPLLRADLDAADIAAIGQALGRVWRHGAAARLDALDPQADWLKPMVQGLGRAGLVPLRFSHFGNWHLRVAGLGWGPYLAARRGALRSAIARRSKRLLPRAVFALVSSLDGLDVGLAGYARVYDASWKAPEPFPQFNPTLVRAVAASGGLRLGLLRVDGVPIAAQFWLLHTLADGRWAGVQKLAHDQAYHALAPGTVLTALMVRHLLDVDNVAELDFGRGDDPYKQQWTGERRQRAGVVLAAPWRATDALQIARHWGGEIQRRRRFSHRQESVLANHPTSE